MSANEVTLVLLAAGRATRFGDVKQLAPVGPSGEALMDYTVFDAVAVGYSRLVVVTSAALADALRGHATARYAGVSTAIVVQDGAPRFGADPGLWGTGHAVLAVADEVGGPFAVCNADDFYGRKALETLHDFLVAGEGGEPPLHCVAGYRLAATLAPSGGVSRAVCEIADGYVTGVAEVHNATDTGGRVTGDLTDGTPVSFSGDEFVSMNLWGFRPGIIPLLAAQFRHHCRGEPNPPSEFYLSNAVGEQIRDGAARLRCLPCPDDWFGMTYSDDRAGVQARIAQLVDAGRYPAALAGGFTGKP